MDTIDFTKICAALGSGFNMEYSVVETLYERAEDGVENVLPDMVSYGKAEDRPTQPTTERRAYEINRRVVEALLTLYHGQGNTPNDPYLPPEGLDDDSFDEWIREDTHRLGLYEAMGYTFMTKNYSVNVTQTYDGKLTAEIDGLLYTLVLTDG